MINYGLRIKNMSMRDITEENVSITKDTLEKMWKNIQNEFNLNSVVENKQKRNTIQEIGFNTDLK